MRPFDLVICSQPLLDKAYVDDDIFEAALFVSGRPTLVLPRDFTGALRAKNILIAWKNCRETTRAIYDSLPLLLSADKVTLMSVKQSEGDLNIGREALDRMTNSLCRRGVKAASRSVVAIAEGIRETVVREADRADLLVMGGYGHWRWTELLFGGLTRKMLQDMRTPVLMSR
jgi:nucleotide-binding universal stress UspA family protein